MLSPFILDELKKYKAKATFFYLGSKAEKYPQLIKRCKDENHKIGNHTYSHPNGWKTKNSRYYQDIEKANKLLNSNLFRPPYGRIKPSQINHLKKYYKIIMWDILSWDFDKKTSPEECYNNIINNTKSIAFCERIPAAQKTKIGCNSLSSSSLLTTSFRGIFIALGTLPALNSVGVLTSIKFTFSISFSLSKIHLMLEVLLFAIISNNHLQH